MLSTWSQGTCAFLCRTIMRFEVRRGQAMWETDTVELERVEEFIAGFQDDFRRRDQVRWAAVYIQGLLTAGERKTVGRMARQAVLPPDMMVDDVAQALQNFINQSPWDEQKLWRRYRNLMQA